MRIQSMLSKMHFNNDKITRMVDESIGLGDYGYSEMIGNDMRINQRVHTERESRKVELFHHIHVPKDNHDSKSNNQSLTMEGDCKYDLIEDSAYLETVSQTTE